MSDSESDYSDDNIDLLNVLLDEANEAAQIKPEPVAQAQVKPKIKQEIKQEIKKEGVTKPKKPSLDNESDAPTKEQLKRKRKTAQLEEIVFGNKPKLLQNLQATAEDGAKKTIKKRKTRKPVWADSDDEGDEYITNLETRKRELKKKENYKKQLEGKFERILGTPAWAALDRKHADDDSDDDILQTVGHLARPVSHALNRGVLSFKKMKDLNRATYAEGPNITGVEFHPLSTVSLVAGSQGVATIYSIDGKKNEKLHSLEFSKYPIRSCRLSKDGTEAIFGGSNKYFYTYDLIGGQTQRVFLPKTITKLGQFEVSPCGQYLGVIGRFGEVHLLHASTKELICTFKQEHTATSLTFSPDSKYLFTHCVDAEVNIFDLHEQKFMHRFIDEGCINGSSISISPNGRMIASGSEQGVVNIYNYEDVFKNNSPMPEKTIMNLTTAISTTKFNHSSELLAFSSKEVTDAVKLVHFPSGTVYSNFPGLQGNFGKPSVVQFSPQSGYLAIGNYSKEVSLYRLKHFNDY